MPLRARFASLWRNLTRRARVEQDLDDELHAILDAIATEKIRAGMTPGEARRAARIELGGIESVKEDVRAVRTGAALDTTWRDVRFAVRLLARNPLFTTTAAASLAIGIGATTAIFTVANGLLLRAAEGVADPGTLVDIVRQERDFDPGVEEISYPDYLDIRDRVTTLHDVYAFQVVLNSATLRVDDSTERTFPGAVSVNYFQALGVRPAAGRLFGAGDSDVAGASPVVVLSHRFWERRFGCDPAVVGRTIRLNDFPMTVIGVASASFRGTTVGAPDLWLPLGMVGILRPVDGDRLLTERGDAGWLLLGARLRPGVSRTQASAEIATIGAALAREFPAAPVVPPLVPLEGGGVRERRDTDFVWSVEIASPIPYGLRILAAGFLALLMALVLVVLAIACVNVSGVLLARATTRRREIAVRVATGAARGRLVRQLFTETVVLFLLGGVSGLLLARALTTVLVWLLPMFEVPIALSVPLDTRVVAFALGLSLVAAFASGLAPALYASRSDVVSALKDDVQGTPERLWLRHAFLVAQVACSLLLIVTAGLLIRALDRVTTLDRGYDPAGVDAAGVQLALGGYTETTGTRFAGDLLEKVRALPAVRSATLASRPPGPGAVNLGGISVPGVRPPAGLEFFYPSWTLVASGYFETLRIPLLDGRDFTDADDGGREPVVILARRTADLFWPEQRAIGQYVMAHVGAYSVPSQATQRTVPRAGTDRPQPPPPIAMRVVGVVEDVNASGPPEMYVPLRQRYWSDLTILARRSADESVAGELRALVSSMDPSLPVLYAQTLASLRTGPVETQLRLAAVVAASVGIVGLLLAALGIYGVTAYAVSRRTREIGIRLSMGAGPADIVTLILRQSMTLIAAGTGIGLLLGLGAGRVLAGDRFGVPPPDAGLLVASAALFTIVGLAASYAPVRRAVRVQAMDALRYE